MADAGKGFLGLLDMIDGGGMGQSGSKFEGGPLSGLLNALGIRPHGYMDRLAAARPQARPAMARPQARPSLPMTGMDEALVAPQYGMPPEQGPFFKDPRMSMASAQMPYEIGNSGSGMDFYQGRGPGRSPTGKRDIMSDARAAFAQQFNALYALPGMDAYADQMRIDPSVVERAFARWMANGGRL